MTDSLEVLRENLFLHNIFNLLEHKLFLYTVNTHTATNYTIYIYYNGNTTKHTDIDYSNKILLLIEQILTKSLIEHTINYFTKHLFKPLKLPYTTV